MTVESFIITDVIIKAKLNNYITSNTKLNIKDKEEEDNLIVKWKLVDECSSGAIFVVWFEK